MHRSVSLLIKKLNFFSSIYLILIPSFNNNDDNKKKKKNYGKSLRCDNIRDCMNGDDEDECKFCNYDEFKCLSDQICITEKWLCDGYEDCIDGSDEKNCDESITESDEEDERIFYDDIKDYGDQTSIDHHNDSDGDKIISTGDDVMPIFINPNETDTNEAQMSSSGMN